MDLKQRVLNYRIKHKVNQIDMAKMLGISELTLIRFMKNTGIKMQGVKEITKMKIEMKLDELEEKDNG